ncbi:MAG: 23S rRNA (pseudouridine(1915)-N(3))-methyltransferase RlmH [Bacteroidaceae bacterium]|nr:23S rRNA (pseudouridine(1915)-N(3))-methyltransferase RlmH [Bacteroidaceae bacterium]
MKATLIMVGKTDGGAYESLLDDYVGRLGHYVRLDVLTIPSVRNAKSLGIDVQKRKEGEAILGLLSEKDVVVLLDECGKERSSVEFARWLEGKCLNARNLVFVIGGPYGFSKDVYDRGDERISLSRMTFSHQMVRVIFAEQLYRAFTIMRGEGYHHE